MSRSLTYAFGVLIIVRMLPAVTVALQVAGPLLLWVLLVVAVAT